MAAIFPFKAYLPANNLEEQVVSKPFDKYTLQEVEQIVKANPRSFLNVIKPDLAAGVHRNPTDPAGLQRSREQFLQFAHENILERQEKPAFYIYRQEKPDFTYTGIIATIASADYRNDTIRIHEQTLALKEEKLKDYLQVVGINAEPVMFTYPHTAEIDELMNRLTAAPPKADFIADGKRQMLWLVDKSEDIRQIQTAFEQVNHVYVADGHHRSASSVLLSEELAHKHPQASKDAPWRSFMGVFFPDHNLQLFAFNRLLKDTGGLSKNQILEKLSLRFHVEEHLSNAVEPQKKQEFSMFIDNCWYLLSFKEEPPAAAQQLDADLLNAYILAPVFNIHDLRNDHRIDFVPGLKGPDALCKKVQSGKAAIAFGLYPVSFEQFFAFSDQGRMMPPKSTWFEPKLLNGLVVYDLEIPEDDRR